MTYTLAEVRNGTGWPEGVRFQVVEPHTECDTCGDVLGPDARQCLTCGACVLCGWATTPDGQL